MIHGWDDAPLASVGLEHAKPITFVYPYYCNPEFLKYQLNNWSKYFSLVKSYLSIIIVDDGSPFGMEAEPIIQRHKLDNVRLFKIDVDVRWNWLAARNIAMHHAEEGWCMATDIDHVVPEEVAWNLIMGKHDENIIYRFNREEWNGNQVHPHPNSWFMTKKNFWKFGGYDEALSGYYGTDGDARRRWVSTAPVLTLPDKLIRHEYVGDSSTTRYKRKEKIDIEAQRIIKRRGKDWKPKVLSFPYHQIQL